jgi:hypothetical protein
MVGKSILFTARFALMTHMEVMMKHNWTLDELIDSWTLLPNEIKLVIFSD